MNKGFFIGRLTATPELKMSKSNVPVCNFTIAVDRKFSNANGEKITDYIDCVAWRNQAEFICKWFGKGVRIAVSGEIQTRIWEDSNSIKRKVYELICAEVEFADGKKETTSSNNNVVVGDADGFMPIADDDVLPWEN